MPGSSKVTPVHSGHPGCGGQHRTLRIDVVGGFVVTAIDNRPGGMPELNDEGFALAGADECVGGTRPVYWADDSDDDGHALRRGSITC
ncbi:MAG TPA: hypothetical protein VFW65_40515 [Pseudonocardiaceae bacterium]|nr:hypothetical protein [Pseudonocardiaceae bacterium]